MRLLIADDEVDIVSVLVEALSELGYHIDAVYDGAAALAALVAGSRIDLLTTDIMMPRLRGDELARRARALRPKLPILVLSGNATPRVATEVLALPGQIAFMPKPFTIPALVGEIERIARLASLS